jgi:hypothetical protein
MARHLRALGEEVGAPVGVVLEGGYALDALAASVAATLALTGNQPPELVAPDFLTGARLRTLGTTGRSKAMANAQLLRDVTLRDGSTLRGRRRSSSASRAGCRPTSASERRCAPCSPPGC